MKHKIIEKTEFLKLVEGLIGKGRTVGVVAKESGKFGYDNLKKASELCLDYDVTVIPPKKYFQPQNEAIVKFKVKPAVKVEAVINSEPITIIGIHPYDMIALSQMDRIFEETNKDTNYLSKRAQATIIGCDPVKASEWSFWSSMGATTPTKGYDLWLTDLGNQYFVEVATSKGEKIIGMAKTTDATKDDEEKRKKSRENLAKLCKNDRQTKARDKEIYHLIKTNYEHKIWEGRAEKCYSCGSCNLVCPTCYCFDVREEFELNLSDGRRARMWDGCLLTEFAAVGSGENFREERFERFRHRIFRKTVYMMDKINELACVGCGRCSSVCLPDIADPVKIINELKEGR